MYIYNDDLYCDDCGLEIMRKLDSEGKKPEDTSDYESYDSDDYPKYADNDSEGEADLPFHCGHCGEFLENSLTNEGFKYVIEAIIRFYGKGEGKAEIIEQWISFYNVSIVPGYAEALDYAEGCYQALCDYHSGQWSISYRYLCILGKHYRPARNANFESMTENSEALACYIQYAIKILKNKW
jgi:hypothetical protein